MESTNERLGSELTLDAEMEFHRVIQILYPYYPPALPGGSDERPYRGKHSLSGLHPTIREQLLLFQNMFNEELRNEKRNVPEHVSHPPFHFDYVDSDIQNALAFRTEHHSFIAITVPLVFALSDICRLLGKSGTVCALLGVAPSTEEYSPLHAVLFSTVLSFVVSHEFVHHVHGHLPCIDTDLRVRNELLDGDSGGDLNEQIREVVADGYSIYHVLANLIDGSGRSWLGVLELDQKQEQLQNEALFLLALLAVAAYFVASPLARLTDVYVLTHPPPPVRMYCIIVEALNWAGYNHPELNASMMTRIPQAMAAASDAASTPANTALWREQIAYLRTAEGARYDKDLTDGVNAYKNARRTGRAEDPVTTQRGRNARLCSAASSCRFTSVFGL